MNSCNSSNDHCSQAFVFECACLSSGSTHHSLNLNFFAPSRLKCLFKVLLISDWLGPRNASLGFLVCALRRSWTVADVEHCTSTPIASSRKEGIFSIALRNHVSLVAAACTTSYHNHFQGYVLLPCCWSFRCPELTTETESQPSKRPKKGCSTKCSGTKGSRT